MAGTITASNLRTPQGLLRPTDELVDRAELGDGAFNDLAPGGGLSLRQGSYGWGGLAISTAGHTGISDCDDTSLVTGFYAFSSNTSGAPFTGPGVLQVIRRQPSAIVQHASRQLGQGTSDVWFTRVYTFDGWGPWGESVTLGHNVTVDSNGFIVESSPILRLFADKITDNGQVKNAEFARNGVGDYTVKDTLGFAQNGWYIKVPQDANGNIKVFVEYEYVEGDINVRTFEPIYDQGKVAKGAPSDIPVGRWIDLRLHQDDATEESAEEDNASSEYAEESRESLND